MTTHQAARRALIGLLIGLGSGLLVWLVTRIGPLETFESRTYDLRLQPHPPRDDIVMVDINESSVQALTPIFGAWPWPRVVHAGVIDFLTRCGARVVAYDVLFIEPDSSGPFTLAGREMTGSDSDSALAEAIRHAGNVLLLANGVYEGTVDEPLPAATADPVLPGPAFSPGPGFQPRPHLILPIPEFAGAAHGIGHNVVPRDEGGPVRRMLPFIDYRGAAVPALGLAAAIAADRIPADEIHLDGDVLHVGRHAVPLLDEPVPARSGEASEPSRQMLLNYAGPPVTADGKRAYQTYPFVNVLISEDRVSGGEPPVIDPSAFKDKIVFVGASAAGLYDVQSTPFPGGGVSGTFLHATLADDVLSDRFMRRASARTDLAVSLAAGVGAGLLIMVLPVVWGGAAVAAGAAGLWAWLTHEVGEGLWIAAIAPLGAAFVSLLGGVAWQYFVEGREKRQMKQLFGRFVSKDIFAHLVANPSLARLGGQRREMTVLFSDIRGFTTASERAAPEALVAQLNEYFTAMVEVLFRHGGTLDKFVGDMVMGLFGAPVADPRHADHAVAAAVEMLARLRALNAKWATEGRPTLDIGVGINSGEMIAGNIGSDTIMSYTVIGDAVNLGSRLESLNKEYDTHILISQGTLDRLTREVKTRLVGDVTVKGKSQPVVVHEVVIDETEVAQP